MSSTLATRIRAELTALQDKHGRLKARDIWIWARANKKSALHQQFSWNMQKAAEAHWTDIANALVTRYLTVQVVHKSNVITTVGYVRDPKLPSDQPGLISLTSDLIEQRDAKQIMMNELTRIESAITRARGVVSQLTKVHPGIDTLLERMIDQLTHIQQKLAA